MQGKGGVRVFDNVVTRNFLGSAGRCGRVPVREQGKPQGSWRMSRNMRSSYFAGRTQEPLACVKYTNKHHQMEATTTSRGCAAGRVWHNPTIA